MNVYLSAAKPMKWACCLSFLCFFQYGQSQSIQQWYDNAQERIDTLRKGNFSLQILDKDGQPYEGEVKVKMLKHEYPFGVAFDFYEGEVTTDVPTETQWMKAAMYKYFNSGVTGNSFKWSGIDPNGNGPNYTNFENALNWAEKVGWELRAHTLLWGGSEGDNHAMPQWVTNLGNANAVYAACEERVRREVSRYKGRVKEYDVVNEPLHATYTQDLYGDSLNWQSFNWAREEDPDAELYINDYNVEFNWGDADEYKALIEEMLDKGAPITGIGMQAHFWDCCRADLNDFVTQINKLAEIGLPIKLTEFDFGGNLTEAGQAAELLLVYTIAFSHPSVSGVIYWNLADHLSWRENAGLFREDHTPKQALDTLRYLTQELWATNFETAVSGTEALAFDAYFGDYIVEVKYSDTIQEFEVPLRKENDGEVFELREAEATPKSPELAEAMMILNNILELHFDTPIKASSANRANFRVFAEGGVSITRIRVKENADSVLIFDLSRPLSATEYATVSYFPGTLASESGTLARAFGTERIGFNTDLNQAPTASVPPYFEVSVDAYAGKIIGVVEASDPEGSALTYRIIEGNTIIFGVGLETGQIVLVNPKLLDLETTPTYYLTIEVSDGVHQITVDVVINFIHGVLNAGRTVELAVYPNPTSGEMYLSSAEGFSKVQIYNLGGQLVWEENFRSRTHERTVLTQLDDGIYLLRAFHEGAVSTSKIVVRTK